MRNPAVKNFSTSAAIIQLVCSHFGVTIAQLENHCRRWAIIWPRWCAIALIKRHTSYSTDQIAALFGMTHGTVLWAIKGVEDQRETDPAAGRELAALESQCQSLLGLHRAITKNSLTLQS